MADDAYTIDEYQLLNCVASGTYSQVWEVLEKGAAKQYAMKLLLPEAFSESEQKQVLKHEAKVAQGLVHPNFVTYHKLVMNKEHGYIVMDYFRAPNVKVQIGSDLASVQSRIHKLVEGLTAAIGFMHEKGWLHKDIKPDNILLNKASEIRLIDFSLAGRMSSGLMRALGGKVKTIQGTRTYIAPETIMRQRPTRATDIYSLGVTLFEILTGEPPFKGSSPTDLLKKHVGTRPPDPSLFNKNVTPEADKFIQKMLAKKPEKRHKDANEVLAEFRNLKVFKEDVQSLSDKVKEREKAKLQSSLDAASRLDSRADALRSDLQKSGVVVPPRKPKPAPRQVPAQKPQPAAPQPPPQPAQHPPAFPQQPYAQPQYYPPPQYPGYAPQQPPMYPPMPGAPLPYGPYPGAYPGQMPAGYPGAPGYPPQQPAGPWPQPAAQNPDVQQLPGQAPPTQRPMQPPAQQPAPAQQPPAQQPPAPKSPPRPAAEPQPAPKKDDKPADDIPFMDELPPVV